MPECKTGFYGELARTLDRHANRILLSAGTRQLTGATLAQAIERWAAGLRELGLKQGDRIAVQAPKSLDLVLLYLASLRLGAIYLPLNSGYTPSEIDYFLGDAEPAIFVCAPQEVETFASLGERAASACSGWTKRGAARCATPWTRPQQVPRTHDAGGCRGGSCGNRLHVGDDRPVQRGDDHAPQPHHQRSFPDRHMGARVRGRAAARFAAVPHSWAVRRAQLDAARRWAMRAAAGIRRGRGDRAAAGGDALHGRAYPLYPPARRGPRSTPRRPAGVRLFVCGSAPLTEAAFADFEARTGQRILERYGMSECGIICSNPLRGERIPGAVGRPLPGVEVRVSARQKSACSKSGGRTSAAAIGASRRKHVPSSGRTASS
jgi:malonyl-CoA/methylmalonyl-CoA synthetase